MLRTELRDMASSIEQLSVSGVTVLSPSCCLLPRVLIWTQPSSRAFVERSPTP